MSRVWMFFGQDFPFMLVQTLGHFLWQGLLVGALAWAVGWMMRRGSAQARYLLYMGALVLLAACPVVTLVILNRAGPVADLSVGAMDDLASGSPKPRLEVQGKAGRDDVGGPVGHLLDAPPAQIRAKTEARREAQIAWQAYAPQMTIAYLAGVVIMLVRLLVALRGGQRLSRQSSPVDDPALLTAIARQVKVIGLTFTPAVACCGRLAVPLVVGVLQPMLLLPASLMLDLAPAQVEALIAHELAHIRRYDHLANLLQRIIEAFLFFHPAVWYISSRVRAERECCCDDLVLAAGSRALEYAESLLRVAELSSYEVPGGRYAAAAALGATGRPSQLRYRILRLLNEPSTERIRLTRQSVIALGAVLVLAVLAPLCLTAQAAVMRDIWMSVGSGATADGLDNLAAQLRANPSLAKMKDAKGWTVLHRAALYGTQAEVQLLLNHGAAVNAPNSKGWTPLHLVAHANRPDIADTLLAAKADLHARDKDGRTPLHIAGGLATLLPVDAPRGIGKEMIAFLVSRGAEINAVDRFGMSALHGAVFSDRLESVQALLERGAAVDLRDKDGRTPLSFAADLGYKAIAEALLARGADFAVQDKIGLTPFHYAAMRINSKRVTQAREVAEMFLARGAKLDIYTAVAMGNHAVADALLKTDPALIKRNNAKTKEAWTLLHWAVGKKDERMVRLLLQYRPELDAANINGHTPLHFAVLEGMTSLAALLLDAGATADVKDRTSEATPLIIAAERAPIEAVELLLRHHADPNAMNYQRRTSLHRAIEAIPEHVASRPPVVKLLLQWGADPNIQDRQGSTPLHMAAGMSRDEMVQILIDAKADVNIRNYRGETPLHLAVSCSHPSVRTVKALLAAKSDVQTRDGRGRTPLSYVASSPDPEIADLLRAHGAKE